MLERKLNRKEEESSVVLSLSAPQIFLKSVGMARCNTTAWLFQDVNHGGISWGTALF